MGFRGVLARKKGDKKGDKASPQPRVQPATAQQPSTASHAHAPATASAAGAMQEWDATRFKIHLKMAKNRVEIQRGKKDNEIESTRRLIASHLSSNKEPLARIQGERVLRERMVIAAFDVLDTFLELLASSNNVFATYRDFDAAPADIQESTASLIYAASRLSVSELSVAVAMLRVHFGPHVVDAISRLEGPHVPHVNNTLALNLQGNTPDGYLVLEELTRIAVDYNVAWIPPPEDIDLNQPGGPAGGGGGGGGSGGYRPMRPSLDMPAYDATAPPSDFSAGFPPMPSNIPGYGGAPAPFGGGGGANVPSAPPAGSAPPFDPAANASGGMYPFPAGYPAGGGSQAGFPPPPPPSGAPGPTSLSDDALEARFRNVNGNLHK